MPRDQIRCSDLAERLCRPQRIGLFGHRGVGKTTLLTMLYREAVGGRLPGLRLAAGDARTADYLSEKILQLESGQPLPATLAETELRFHLYQGDNRLDVLMRDYQGEHVELGREEPIREFLRDCDAVWLCLDAANLSQPETRLRRQQEIEQLMEDYLAAEPNRTMNRPVALVLTKADLLGADPATANAADWAKSLDMARHALQTHCPHSGLFSVSSLGRPLQPRDGETVATGAQPLEPCNLAEPLFWLVQALQAQDGARLEQLFTQTCKLPVLTRAVACFTGRYPEAQTVSHYRDRLRIIRWRQQRWRSLLGAAAAACLTVALTAYDALGYQQAARFEADHRADPTTALAGWKRYQNWHPTRRWLGPGSAHESERHVQELRQAARSQARTENLIALRQLAADVEADPQAAWHQLRTFQERFPEAEADLDRLRATLKERRDAEAARLARQAFADLESAEEQAAELPALLTQTDRFLRDYPTSAEAAEVQRRRTAYVLRLDERDIQPARDFSAREPLNFPARRDYYLNYLAKHPGGGVFRQEAETALRSIAADWDKHDFRLLRDLFLANPGTTSAWVGRCRSYLAVHPAGQFKTGAEDLLRWSERITQPHEYRVTLRDGQFDRSVARFFSRGPKLSVELEVAGVRYGPSTISTNRYDPEWNYEFPRRIRWRSGDAVHIRVTEHSWSDRVVLDLSYPEGDPLAIQLLTGEVWSGTNRLTFESDFVLPTLPTIE